MSGQNFKVVKTRKVHLCSNCSNEIALGELAEYSTWRQQREDKNEVQIGIEYVKLYLHHELKNCPEESKQL